MVKVLFVCHGNICRSPMAEFVMRYLAAQKGLSDAIEVASAATSTEEIGEDVHHGTRAVLTKHGIPFSRRSARQINKSDYREYDYIVGMDRRNVSNMMRAFGGDPEGKVSLLMDWAGVTRDVADPWYTGDFDTTFDDVESGCTSLLSHIERTMQRR